MSLQQITIDQIVNFNASTIGSTLTGYTSGAGTISSSDTVLSAIQKLNGNIGVGGGVTSVTGTTNRVTSSGGSTPAVDIAATYVGQSSITTLGTISTGVWQGTAIADTYISSASTWNSKQAALSGTGFVKSTGGTISYDTSTYITGNQTITLSGAVTGSGTTTIATTLASSTVGITNLSATGTPSSTTYLRGDNTWATVSGGFSNPMTTLGDMIYEDATPTAVRLAGNTAATLKFLTQTGNGTISAAPVWTSTLPIANGGTGSTTQNFVDLTTTQTVAGNKTFSGVTNFTGTELDVNTVLKYLTLGTNGFNFWVPGQSHIPTGFTTTALLFAGATTVTSLAVFARNITGDNLTTGESYATLLLGTPPQTGTFTSGTHALIAQQVINPLIAWTINGTATITNTASLYINGQSTTTVTGANYGLWVNSATARIDGNLILGTAGNKISIATGTNASAGTATLASGTVTISTTAVTASSLIFVAYNTPSGTLASGLSAPVGSITAGTSFVINSLTTAGVVNTLDNSTVRWWFIN